MSVSQITLFVYLTFSFLTFFILIKMVILQHNKLTLYDVLMALLVGFFTPLAIYVLISESDNITLWKKNDP